MGAKEKTSGEQRMLWRWSELTTKNPTAIAEWLCRVKGYKKIALYTESGESSTDLRCFSTIDKLAVEELMKSDKISLEYIITDISDSIVNIPNISVDSISSEQMRLADVDAVVVVQYDLVTKVKKQFSDEDFGTNTKIYALAEIILEMWRYETQEKPFVEELIQLQNDNVPILYFEAPILEPEGDEKTEWEQYIIDNAIINRASWQKNGEGFQRAFELSGYVSKYTLEDYRENLSKVVPTVPYKNYRKNQDIDGKYVNIVDGNRIVMNIPSEYKKRVLIFGDTATMGVFLEDKDTSACRLQEILNDSVEEDIRVEHLAVRTSTFLDLANQIADTQINACDIAVFIRRGGTAGPLFYALLEENNIAYHISTPDFRRPHNWGEVFLDIYHPNWNGNQAIAELIYQEIFKKAKGMANEEKSRSTLEGAAEEDVAIEDRLTKLFEAQDYDAIKRLVLPSKVRDSEGEGSIEGEKYD